MCYHHRLLHTCNHSTILSLSRPCRTELAFTTHQTNTGCSAVWAHPLATLRVQTMCRSCLSKKSKLDTTVSRLKESLQRLNEDMARRTTPGKGRDSLESNTTGVGGSETSVGGGSSSSNISEMDMEREVEALASESEASKTEAHVEHPDIVEMKRNEFFTGGTCLASTTLVTGSGVILF